ncbi:MAG: hypothetical protein DMD41_13525, partial [Gemmatimonadetes bacterium]
DPTVGVASSTCVSVARIDGDANRGQSSYLGYEMWVRDLETRFRGIVVAGGWLYAARASIQRHVLPGGLCRDFAAPLIARERGFRAVSVADAICLKPRVLSLRREYRRKVRTITRGWHTVYFKRQLLNPLRYGAFAWILATHKICRWLVPHVSALALVTLACLVRSTPWAGWGLGLAAFAGLCAALGWWWPEGRQLPQPLAVPAYIVLGQLAALHASIRAVAGKDTPTWEPARQEPGPRAMGTREGASSDVAGSGREILLVVSVDTEEDNWEGARSGITVENVREVRRLRRFFNSLGVRPTYFTTYQVVKQPWAADLLREVRDGGAAEIGAHLHPWNTPPLVEPLTPRNAVMKNLAPELQLEKLKRLTAALEDALGAPPPAFRAGRFGLGADAVSALLTCGYQVDSSVTPFVSWERWDGPTFVGAPLNVYRIGVGRDVRVPEPRGPLVEVPITAGYTRFSSSQWSLVHRLLHAGPSRAVRVAGLAARLGVVRVTMLTPELQSVRDMLALSRGALEGGVRLLHVFFHSVALRPGLSPLTSSAGDVGRLYKTIDSYVEGLSRIGSVRFATVSEAGIALGPARQPCVRDSPAASPRLRG